ncbi:hypothetical protein SUGI_0348510 [Cryptomeria japonica]|uniref:uncharacterized protein LOC131038996 n=1 Tax=Cryptomeria japonica TaxID=3369 RepID=UPI002408DA1F|nr:uncharacterized protein LOC131038996 [Cryptomeria japonica]XP_057827612.2 uncharacterized protein LOC131038996 [Cryptomeria japonica]XP_057827613.2 uncharacterized protein LOC131038996 [Cryptomeria japonica]GLJ19344.1 hypothetical protein SUGI_0348510 [Cryptomeria japonica]
MEDVQRSMEAKMPMYDCLIFDLDDTLYPLSSGLQAACRKNIEVYMSEKLKIDQTEVPTMCYDLYKRYGTTMAGLKVLGYEFDNDDFHSFVHGSLPYENLRPDPVLRSLLLSTPQRKIVFTNSDKVHAAKTLSRLGLEDCFEGVICFETLNTPSPTFYNTNDLETPKLSPGERTCDNVLETPKLSPGELACDNVLETTNPCPVNGGNTDVLKSPLILCKPSLEAMEFALKIANADPKRTIFFDDSTRNIAVAKAAGLHTVLVGTSVRTDEADFALRSIHNIKEALPEIWEDGEKSELSSQSISIETVVVA